MNGDWCTPEGARKLKQRIESYWKERGYDVDIDLVDAGFTPSMRSGRTDVRSNMRNGMPNRRPLGEQLSEYDTTDVEMDFVTHH
jgi:hypothetical protein